MDVEPVSPEGPACILFSKTTRRQTSTKETHDTRPRQDTRPQRRRSKRENGKAQQCFVKKTEVKSSSYSPQKYKKSATLRLPLPLPLSIINDDERKTKQVKAKDGGLAGSGLRWFMSYRGVQAICLGLFAQKASHLRCSCLFVFKWGEYGV